MKKRIYFDKCDNMKFISHLDLLRFFERIFTRAELPIKFTQGFHPRPKCSFGNPVSLGTEAYNEVMEVELERDMTDDEIIKSLEFANNKGFRICKVETVTDKISIPDRFKVAIYQLSGKKENIDKVLEVLLQDEIILKKEKDGKATEKDLKSQLKKVERLDDETIEINLINKSPNIFVEMAGLPQFEIGIKKLGYNLEG